MKRKQVHPKEASVAATFFEPVYQRLRQWHIGRAINLLCFVHETSATVQQLLDHYGAKRSKDFRAGCFAEIWELPDDAHVSQLFQGGTAELDKRISEALGCLGGRFSSATGNLLWGDIQQGDRRRHFASRLLQESLTKIPRAR
jgi:hypothetical protein